MGYFPPQSNIDFFGGENFYEESQKKRRRKKRSKKGQYSSNLLARFSKMVALKFILS